MATYFDITQLPLTTLTAVWTAFRVTARNADGTVDAAFAGTVTFTSTDPDAVLPANYTFTGGDAGVRDFPIKFNTEQANVLTATSGGLVGNARTTTSDAPPGWGLDDHAFLPYGDAAAGVGSSLARAVAHSTHEVDVTVTNPVRDRSPFVTGDALNPNTWTIQRLDTAVFLHVLAVTQISPTVFRLQTLEPFGPVLVTHRVNADALLDDSDAPINAPRNADFAGILDVGLTTYTNQLATGRYAARDVANTQLPGIATVGGTLELDAGGDYRTVTGPALTRKLLIRRLTTRPRDFFHLPTYGVGLRAKEPLPTGDLPKLKKLIEDQCLLEPEVDSPVCSLLLDPANGILIVTVKATDKTTGSPIEAGFKVTETGVVL